MYDQEFAGRQHQTDNRFVSPIFLSDDSSGQGWTLTSFIIHGPIGEKPETESHEEIAPTGSLIGWSALPGLRTVSAGGLRGVVRRRTMVEPVLGPSVLGTGVFGLLIRFRIMQSWQAGKASGIWARGVSTREEKDSSTQVPKT